MFQDYDLATVIIYATIALAVNLGVLYLIIQSATSSKSIVKLHKMQIDLLKEIALKNGVAPERVDSITKEKILIQ